jgi:DNA-nicking Smr family endonuclease
MTLRKLRRNFWPIQDKLDMHGLHSGAARRLLQEFLHHAREQQLRCVLVIHGKGLNSASGEAVLKARTRHWLTQHPGILAYCDAPPKEGGTGAVLILLKTSPA